LEIQLTAVSSSGMARPERRARSAGLAIREASVRGATPQPSGPDPNAAQPSVHPRDRFSRRLGRRGTRRRNRAEQERCGASGAAPRGTPRGAPSGAPGGSSLARLWLPAGLSDARADRTRGRVPLLAPPSWLLLVWRPALLSRPLERRRVRSV